MFELYTEKARRVIFFARFEAGRQEIYTGNIELSHLLLALVREAWEVIELSGRDKEIIQASIEAQAATKSAKSVPTSVDMPLSHPSRRALAYASEEAERLADRNIDASHLLLGIMREAPEFIKRHVGFDDLMSMRERFARMKSIAPETAFTGTVHAGMTSAGPLPPERAAVLHAVAAALHEKAVKIQITTAAGTKTFSFGPLGGSPPTAAS